MKFSRLLHIIEEDNVLNIDDRIDKFFRILESYQIDSFNKEELYNAYINLPEDFKRATTPSRRKLRNCFRGNDIRQSSLAMSFGYNKDRDIAKNSARVLFGHVVIGIDDLESYDGIFDLDLVERYFGKIKFRKIDNEYFFHYGENEVIVFGGKIKNEEIL